MPGDSAFIKKLGSVFFDSYFVVDRDRRVVDFNEGFVQLLGIRSGQKNQIPNTPCYEMLKLGICKHDCIALESLKKGEHIRKEMITGKAPDGRDLVLELSAIPLRDEQGNVEGVFVTHRDVSDERRLKSRYLEERDQSKKERDALLKIIKDRDEELEKLREQSKLNR